MEDDELLEVFKGKTFSELLKDVYYNTIQNRKMINTFLDESQEFDNPAFKLEAASQYLDKHLKNDDNLIKMAGIFQRHVASANRGAKPAVDGFLTEEEKLQLIDISKSSLNVLKKGD